MPPPASTRTRGAASRALALAALAASACSLSQNGVDPPADTFFYPTGAIKNPTDTAGNWLYVANSNADLRFNDGTLVMVNVGMQTGLGTMSGAAFDRTQFWSQCPQEDYVNPLPRSNAPICCRDLLDPNIINCDERRYVAADATVAIGSFAAGMVWQPYCNLGGVFQDPSSTTPTCPVDPATNELAESPGRVLIGVRGDTSLTDVDVVPPGPVGIAYRNAAPHPAFHCTAHDDKLTPTLAECDQKIQETGTTLTVLAGDTSASQVDLPDEPYALALDPTQGFLYVGHLVGNTSTQDSGGVSLFDASGVGLAPPTFPMPPRFIAPFGSPFPPNSAGQFGITNLHMHESLGSPPGQNMRLYASSRYVPLVTSLTVIGPSYGGSEIQDNVVIPAGDTLNTGLVGSEVRGVEFIEPPSSQTTTEVPTFASRAFALQRVPPDLVGFDISQTYDGATTVIPTDLTETCSSPTFLYQYPAASDVTSENPSRLFINCFDTGEVYVVDPAVPSLITTLMVGRGPAGMVFDAPNAVAYVLNFTQNNVVVLDLAPGSPTQYHVIQRLGFPTVTPR